MPDETNGKNPPAPQPPEKPAAETPGAPKPPAVKAEEQVAPTTTGVKQEGKPEAAAKPAPPAAAPSTPAPGAPQAGAPAKPAAPAAAKAGAAAAGAPAKPVAPAAPKPPAGPTPQPWDTAMTAGLKQRFGSAIKEAVTYVGQPYLVVDQAVTTEVLQILRDEEQFDYLVDVTAVHYPKRELQFDIVWILYSFAKNERIRVKTQIKDGEAAPSAVAFWPTADWLERECFDMFGIQFAGHPGLKRILLPDGWKGHPLRKEYGIFQQDKEWVQINLGIESGQ